MTKKCGAGNEAQTRNFELGKLKVVNTQTVYVS